MEMSDTNKFAHYDPYTSKTKYLQQTGTNPMYEKVYETRLHARGISASTCKNALIGRNTIIKIDNVNIYK